MKTRLSILVLIGIMMTACYTGRPVAKQVPQNNDTYKVDYLFEHDGCKVYRFYDRGVIMFILRTVPERLRLLVLILQNSGYRQLSGLQNKQFTGILTLSSISIMALIRYI